MKIFSKSQLIGLSVLVLFIIMLIALAKYCKREKVITEAPKTVEKAINLDSLQSAEKQYYRDSIRTILQNHRIVLKQKDNAIQALKASKSKVLIEWRDRPSIETAKLVINQQDSLLALQEQYIIRQDIVINNQEKVITSYKQEVAQKNLTILELTYISEKQNERLVKATRPKRFVFSAGLQHGYNAQLKRDTNLGLHVGIPLITF